MYNTPVPPKTELPSSARLLKIDNHCHRDISNRSGNGRPSEYGIDPTRVGKVLGLKEMGEVKSQLADEAEADRQRSSRLEGRSGSTARGQPSIIGQLLASLIATPAYAHDGQDQYERQTDETSVILVPGEGMELKLEMHKGDVVEFGWKTGGAVVNFNLHGEAEGESVTYEKGRAVTAKDGRFQALFDGEHGWWWRNRTGENVTIILRTSGRYGEIKQYR